MATQLRLLDGGHRPRRRAGAGPDWVLDPKTRQVGRLGIAAARAALEQSMPPDPEGPLRRAG
jgi:hypothetical protein